MERNVGRVNAHLKLVTERRASACVSNVMKYRRGVVCARIRCNERLKLVKEGDKGRLVGNARWRKSKKRGSRRAKVKVKVRVEREWREMEVDG